LAAAIVRAAEKRNLPLLSVGQFNSSTGEGVTGVVDGKKIQVGKLKWMEANHLPIPDSLRNQAKQAQDLTQTVIFIAVNDQVIGFLAVADPIKTSTPAAITQLHQLGIKVGMLTGDNESTVKNKLSAARKAVMVLFSIMKMAVFLNRYRIASWTCQGHWSSFVIDQRKSLNDS
jgi:P-type Cu+ transporter